jgi:predicted nucleotidyltransferase
MEGAPMRRDEAIRLLSEHRAELEAMGVTSLALFGSVAHDEAGPDSDVDVIIDVRRPFGLFELAAVHLRLEEIFGRKVDVITYGGLRPRHRAVIEPDLIHVS